MASSHPISSAVSRAPNTCPATPPASPFDFGGVIALGLTRPERDILYNCCHTQETTYITKSNDITSKTTITLPVSTSTKYETVTLGSGVETKIVTAQPKTVTRTSKSTVTTVSWATKTSKGAAMCTS